MEALIEFGRGPFFRFAVALALLGLARHAVLSIAGFLGARSRAGDRSLDARAVLSATLTRLNPVRYLTGRRRNYTILSVAFHPGLVLVPLFYLGHVRLWERGLGISWPALWGWLADGLTVVTIVAGLGLLVARAAEPTSRSLSRFQDWALPPLIVFEFATGYLLAHPAQNPFGLDGLLLLHVWLGALLLAVTPFTKIAHCVLLPLSQMVTEMAWRLVPGAGAEVTRTLGKEGQPI